MIVAAASAAAAVAASTVTEIAAKEKINGSYVSRILRLTLLAPTIVAAKITLGSMNQILNAFSQVRTSFQYLVNSWSTIVELISIYQRLRGFEAKIHDEPLPSIETQMEPMSL